MSQKLLTTYYLLLTTCYLLLATYCPRGATRSLSEVPCPSSRAAHSRLPTSWSRSYPSCKPWRMHKCTSGVEGEFQPRCVRGCPVHDAGRACMSVLKLRWTDGRRGASGRKAMAAQGGFAAKSWAAILIWRSHLGAVLLPDQP